MAYESDVDLRTTCTAAAVHRAGCGEIIRHPQRVGRGANRLGLAEQIAEMRPDGEDGRWPDAGAYHVHFFWDTLPVINAGSNGPDPGSWLLWDTPFEVSDAFFDVANRPEGSRQIGVVIADSGHAVADGTRDGAPDTGTGDCTDLPDG